MSAWDSGIVAHEAMAGAGSALPGGMRSAVSNPAAAWDIRERIIYGATRLTETGDGLQYFLAYAEPDNGTAAGVLAWGQWLEKTNVDTVTADAFYDTTTSWSYVVASALDWQTTGGLSIHYKSVQSDELNMIGNGYRLDAGVVRAIRPGLRAAFHIEGLLSTGVRWSDDTVLDDNRTVVLGAAWVSNVGEVAVDYVMDAKEGRKGFRTGAATNVGPFRVMAGVNALGQAAHLSGGIGYDSGTTRLEYAYSQENLTHQVGFSLLF